MTYEIFRLCQPVGNVDFCGTVEAASLQEAEDIARLMHPCDGGDRLSVEEAKET